jgi:hypothetical protein
MAKPVAWAAENPRFILRFFAGSASANHPAAGRAGGARLEGADVADVLVGKFLNEGEVAPQAAFRQGIKRAVRQAGRHGQILTKGNCRQHTPLHGLYQSFLFLIV